MKVFKEEKRDWKINSTNGNMMLFTKKKLGKCL